MAKTKDEVKILLLQFRLSSAMRKQEWECYLEHSKLHKNQIIPHYLLEKSFNVKNLKNCDAVIVGGTGDFGVYEVEEKYPRAYRELKEIAEYSKVNNLPVLSVCMQFWAVLFGGEVKTDASRQEVGTHRVYLTNEAKDDLLFQDMPQEFLAQFGHKEYVSKLPEGAVCLAYTNLCPVAAFRHDNAYFCQIHPELDPDSMMERINAYRSYVTDEEYKRVVSNLRETPENNSLLRKWIERIVLKK